MTSRWYWRELTEDGLLKPVKVQGYGWTETVFGSYGYETKEEAVEAFKSEFSNKYTSTIYMLVELHGTTY